MNADFGILGANGSFYFFGFFVLVCYYFIGSSTSTGVVMRYVSHKALS